MFPMVKNGSVEPAPKDFIDQGWSAKFFDDLRCDAFYLFDNNPLSFVIPFTA